MSADAVNDCYIGIELSQRTWLIGYLLPGSDRVIFEDFDHHPHGENRCKIERLPSSRS